MTGRQQDAGRRRHRVEGSSQRPGDDNGADPVEQRRELVAHQQRPDRRETATRHRQRQSDAKLLPGADPLRSPGQQPRLGKSEPREQRQRLVHGHVGQAINQRTSRQRSSGDVDDRSSHAARPGHHAPQQRRLARPARANQQDDLAGRRHGAVEHVAGDPPRRLASPKRLGAEPPLQLPDAGLLLIHRQPPWLGVVVRPVRRKPTARSTSAGLLANRRTRPARRAAACVAC